MSYGEKPEVRALSELEGVARLVMEELATWRKRAQRAEQALGADYDVVAQRERVLDLEAQNRELVERLDVARTRLEELLKRLQFLEQQMAVEEHAR